MHRARMAPASASGATTLLVYDHEIGAPITMDLRTFCQETIALSPAPDGDLVANFTVYGGHVRADYYLVNRSSAPRPNGSTPISLPEPIKISDEEAQAILAEQTRQGSR